MGNRKNILVAPLNWGLGHASRCIPIIKALERNGFTPILASDGASLQFLKNEFPHLIALELPSYGIEYTKKGAHFKWKLLLNGPTMMSAIVKEQQLVDQWVNEYQLKGIISDNRLGVRNKQVPSVFITHQLKVLSGTTTWLSSKIHQHFIAKFSECWVPDVEGTPNLSGRLGHLKSTNLPIKYIGVLSSMQKKEVPLKYQLLVLLSGPEPQRTLLEEKLTDTLRDNKFKTLFIRGKVAEQQQIEQVNQITFYNYMQREELEQAFNESEMVLSRSGYTTIMDVSVLQKKAFFIPTPGQYEQEYLAGYYKELKIANSSTQDDFKIKDVFDSATEYKGFSTLESTNPWEELFRLF
jgi:predicted glycosyltransferase